MNNSNNYQIKRYTIKQYSIYFSYPRPNSRSSNTKKQSYETIQVNTLQLKFGWSDFAAFRLK